MSRQSREGSFIFLIKQRVGDGVSDDLFLIHPVHIICRCQMLRFKVNTGAENIAWPFRSLARMATRGNLQNNMLSNIAYVLEFMWESSRAIG